MEAAPSLAEVLATIPDPSDLSGRRYPLPVVLNLVVVATLAGMRSLEAIAPFARDHGTPLAHALGFRSAKAPCKATLSNLLRQLDVGAVEAALSRWIAARYPRSGTNSASTARPCGAPATGPPPAFICSPPGSVSVCGVGILTASLLPARRSVAA